MEDLKKVVELTEKIDQREESVDHKVLNVFKKKTRKLTKLLAQIRVQARYPDIEGS